MTHPKKPREAEALLRKIEDCLFDEDGEECKCQKIIIDALDQARRDGFEMAKKQALALISKQECEVGHFLYFYNTVYEKLKYPEA